MRNAAFALLALGCGAIDDDADYAEARATAECNRIERCSLGFFESEYSSDEDCVDERKDAIAEDDAALDDIGCTYVPAEAGACVRRINGLSCVEYYEGRSGTACDLVWDCTDVEGF
ncbi:MAG: hypothetical protein ABMB14_38850 [Myxococcota bacterium]